MNARKEIRSVLFGASLALVAGVFSASSFGMPAPAGVDALGRSSGWMASHDLGAVPKVAVGRDVNSVSGRAGARMLPARKAGASTESVTIESRDIRTFGRG